MSKNNNGFTLIELLAVIVILAIVLIIAVPSIGNIIEKSKKDTFESSSKGIMEAAKYFYSRNMISNPADYEFSFDDGKKGEATIGEETYRLQFDGKAPTEGRVILYKDGKIDMSICNDTYCACKPDNTSIVSVIVRSEDGPCVLNEDGTVADNPVLSSQLQTLQDQIDALSDDFDDSQDNYLKDVYPVGSIYMSINSTNPGSGSDPIFPGTTWVAWGTGKVPVGVDTSDTAFDTVEKTGGEKTHTLSIDEMPSHTHAFTGSSVTTFSGGAHTHPFEGLVVNNPSGAFMVNDGAGDYFTVADNAVPGVNGTQAVTRSTYSSGAHTHTVTAAGTNSSIGSNTPHNNLQPYITVYMWKRTN